MTDSEFLMWIHARLEKVHGENRLVDYMQKLRRIAQGLDTNHRPTVNSNPQLNRRTAASTD